MESAKIKEIIENMINSMGISFDSIEMTEDNDSGKKVFTIKTSESDLLIGENGETFNSLQHLIKRIIEKTDFSISALFSLDVNDYRASQIEKLKLKAKILANRARDMKASIEMDPMSSYERLIIHGALTGEANISTESVGEGRDRRIIIKYVENSI